MELFPEGGFVRLQSRATGKYVHADSDWKGVSLRPLGVGVGTAASVWRVEHVTVNEEEMPRPDYPGNAASVWRPPPQCCTAAANQNQEVVFVLLQNAAYGRYLAFSTHKQAGHRGRRAVQADRNEPPKNGPVHTFPWWWKVQRVVEPNNNQNYVVVRYGNTLFGLRANGRYRRWNTGITVDVDRRPTLTTMMQWTVHLVPHNPVPRALPLPDAPPQPLQIQGGRCHGLLFWGRTGNRGSGVHQLQARTIRHVRASDEGDYDEDHLHWHTFDSYDHSVINLRTELGQLHNEDMLGFTLCIRSGFHGRLMPLVTDLPRSLDPINIVVLRTGTPAAAALVYPQIDAQAQ